MKLFLLIIPLLLLSCTPQPRNVQEAAEPLMMYPDYENVTIPCNVAPLNFLLRDERVDALSVRVTGTTDSLCLSARGRKAIFPIREWKQLLAAEQGNQLTVTVTARVSGQWLRYPAFTWTVVSEPIDAYVSYRLIEPAYEVWNSLQIRERCIENFEEKLLADNSRLGNGCMNCHVHGQSRGDLSLFHLRGSQGGTILNRDGRLRKLTLKNDSICPNGTVYGEIHPSGRYAVFSSNVIIPMFHAYGSRRLEVYDTTSDLILTDFDTNRFITSPLVADTATLETFPAFSPDGCYIYFCTAPAVPLPDSIQALRYSLCRIPFDEASGTWGSEVDTLYNARTLGGSVCHPKASPDGRHLLFTLADYGTFPIWHRETELRLLDLQTGRLDSLQAVNSSLSDTYHSWSSSGHWFAFASKRGDGQYGRIYFAYFDPQTGKAHRPFVLPQADPELDDLTFKSYNIPDLSASSVPFSARDVERIYNETLSEPFK